MISVYINLSIRGLTSFIVIREDVIKQIENLNPNKSTGPDEVSAMVFNEYKEELGEPQCSIFNKSLESGRVPESPRVVNVVPISKKGYRSLLSDYRLISLMSTVDFFFFLIDNSKSHSSSS